MIDSRSSGASKLGLIGLFTLIALMLVAGGYWFYRQEVKAIRNHKYDDLKVIADLKINQIVHWRNERIGDARLNAAAPFLQSAVIRLQKTPGDAGLKAVIRERLKLVKDSYSYENVILTDREGRVLVTLNPRLIEMEAETKGLTTKAVSSPQVVFGDFVRCSDCKKAHLDVAAPILDQAGEPAAVLILRTDPSVYLYPLIQSWPTISKSAETLLIRRADQEVLFLNVVRHRADPALTFRIPLSRIEVPAVQAALRKTGIFEGRDYRGTPVLADIRPVPNSPWFMVAKLDKNEILSEAVDHARLIGLLTLSLVLLAGAGTAFFYKRQGKRTFQALYRAERERAEIAEEARVTLYSIGDAVITLGADGMVKQMNPVAEQLTGWKETEAAGRPLSQVFRIVNEETGDLVENPFDRVLREGLIVGLANHTLLIAKDGTERPIADSGAPIRDKTGKIIGAALVFRDQTEERKNQAALRESMKEKAFFGDLIEKSSQPIAVRYQDSRLDLVTSAFCKLVGYSGEELKSKDWRNILTPPEWREKEDRSLEELTQTGIPVRYEKEYIRKDGSRVPVELFVHLVRDETGPPLYYIAFITDITERKRAEEALRESEIRFRTLSEKSPLGISFIDADGRYEYVNPAFVSIFGWDLSDIFSGRDWFSLAYPDPDYRRKVIAGWKEDLSKYEEEEARPRTYEVMTKNGERKTVLFRPVTLRSGKQFIIYEDITERKQVEKALQESEDIFRNFMEHSPIYVFFKDENLRSSRLSKNFEQMLGKPIEELLGKSMDDLFPSELAKSMVADDRRIMEEGQVITVEEELNGRIYSTTKFPIFIDGKPRFLAGYSVDITDHKQAEEALRDSERRWRLSIDNMLEAYALHEAIFDETGRMVDYRFLEFNPAAQRISNISRENIVGRTATELYPHVVERGLMDRYAEVMATGVPAVLDDFYYAGDNLDKAFDISCFRIDHRHFVCVFRDITERKNTEEALRRSEQLLKDTQSISKIGGWEYDITTKRTAWTDEVYRIYGVDKNFDPNNIEADIRFYSEKDRDIINRAFWNAVNSGEPYDLELRFNSADGQQKWVRTMGNPTLKDGKIVKVFGNIMDITREKKAEKALRDSEERYRTLVEKASQTILVVQDQTIKFSNPKAIELFGYTGESPTVDSSFLAYVHPEDRAMIRERYRKRLEGKEVFPLTNSYRIIDLQGKMKWVELNSAFISWEGRPAVMVLLEDITDRKKAEEKVIEGAEKLREAISGIVQAMAATVEVKDPYTAGHQRRVADLSRAIAQDLGFSDDRIEGIHMAGMIHDLGKLSVPAEILSKPTQLTEIEFSLIKVHPQAGYDILKEIDFPWPIARIVFQHHERINGSGYPLMLKEEDILPEAKVLAVADVVEAIASYRPYRPGRGIDKALEEIEMNQGILYDPEAVRTCLKLFREKGYSLS